MKIFNLEFNKTFIRRNEQIYKLPKFYHTKVCSWYDIFGVKIYKFVYYVIVIHKSKAI